MYCKNIEGKIDKIKIVEIRNLIKSEYEKKSAPTQASSNFITNKEQGDWAENLLFNAINKTFDEVVAVKYGKSDDLIAGDEKFNDFYDEYQNELATIGKRPDLLIFKKSDYLECFGNDISGYPHEEIDEYVSKAIAGIEVRSSAFLVAKYEEYNRQERDKLLLEIENLKNEILGYELLKVTNTESAKKYVAFLTSFEINSIEKVPTRPVSKKIPENQVNKMKSLKEKIDKVLKRDTLSITPKLEDLQVVYRWIQTYNVPHFYVQVFFDRIYGISFEEILDSLGEGDKSYSIERDAKNQGKTTIKININDTINISEEIEEPNYIGKRKELSRGRLLFYTEFKDGIAILKKGEITSLLGIESRENEN